jgi:hypothetical protein
MGLLTPAFLAGLIALAVPILVHLTHRPRSDTIAFPSLMFLQRIPYRSVRRQSLRHWLLFALRCAAFALLALAFARPFFGTSSRAATATEGARARVILLDRSFSMQYRDHWKKGVEAARRSLAELGPQDTASLVLFDRTPESTGEPTTDRARLLAALDAARPGFGVTRYAPALRLAEETLEGSLRARRQIVLITDFQKVGWEGGDDVRLPASTTLTWVDLSERDASNVAITGVDLERDYVGGRERVIPAARLVNKGPHPVSDLEVALEVDGRPVRQQRVSLAPNTSATVLFDAFPLPPSAARATVRAASDGLATDDAFHFVLAPGGDVPVLIVEAGPSRDRSLYLRRALAIGHRPRFRVETREAARLTADDFAARPMVVLDEAAPPAGAAGARLRALVQDGGGLFVVLGEQAAAGAWTGETASLLPGTFGPAVDRSSDWGGTLAAVDYAHPIFEVFRGPHGGDFSTARFFRYRPLAAKDGVLARFDDGGVALAEKTVGKGHVLVWTSTLDASWNDLPLQPVFLPFLHRLVQHAAGHVESRPWHTVGEALDLGSDKALRQAEAVVIAPSGERSRLAAGSKGVELTAPGFYEVRALDSGAPVQVAAVNVDPAESDLAALDPEELAGALTRAGQEAAVRRSEPAPTAEEHEGRQALWRDVLMAALVLLAAETVLSNRLSVRAGAK